MQAAASLAGQVTLPADDEPFPSQPSPPRHPPLTAVPSPASDAMMPMLDLEAPVVVMRLPGKRPRCRPWSPAEEVRLTDVCQNFWPDVNWPLVAGELGRDVRDCISRSTLLHLQDLRGEAPVSSPKEFSPTHSQPAQSAEQQLQNEDDDTMPTATRTIGKGFKDKGFHIASGSLHKTEASSNNSSRKSSSSSSSRSSSCSSSSSSSSSNYNSSGGGGGGGSSSSSSSSSSSVINNPLPSQVVALALQHQFDWVAVGRALKADPWECWKTYEAYTQEKNFHSDDTDASHGPTTISSLADDVAAFLPFASSPSSLRRNPRAPPYDTFNHHQSPVASATTAAVTTGGEDDKGSNNRSNICSPISPPPSALSPLMGAGGPSFLLHHFPRPNPRSRLSVSPQAPASSTATTTITTPAASFLRSFSTSSFQQPGVSPNGGGKGGGGEGETQMHQPGGLQDSVYSTFSGMGGGGGGGASIFLPGSESMSLSMVQSAMLDMPSLYLGQSTAFGAGASTFLVGGGSTLSPPGAAGVGAPGADVDGGGPDDLLPPFPPHTAPPFLSSSPVLQPWPRGLTGPTHALIPSTIIEGSEAGGCSTGTLDQSELKK